MLKQIEQEFLIRLGRLYDPHEIKEMFFMSAEEILNLSRTRIILQKPMKLTSEEEAALKSLLSTLEGGVPIQYALGYAWFYRMKLKVSEAVLIPRPETEELVALILKENQSSEVKILDIGTGSGCIPIALKKNLPKSEVWALDVSKDALKVAGLNAKREDCLINFIEADILKVKSLIPMQKFDTIVSNPPYITPSEQSSMDLNVLNHEPHLALFITEEKPLLFYDAIAAFAQVHLKDGGKLYFEINRRFGKELKSNLERLGFLYVKIHQDMYGADRMLSCMK